MNQSEQFIQDLVRRITNLERESREQVGKSPLFDIANENTPAQLTGDQTNYDPGNYDVLRLDSSLAVNIGGISSGKKGRFLELINVGSSNITLLHQALGSTAENRIITSTGASVIIAPNDRKRLYYDSTTARWRV